MRLRSYLTVLVLAGAVPLVLLTAAVTVTLWRQQKAAVDNGLSETVSALASVVAAEIQSSLKSLETLGASRALDHDDLPAFYEQAQRVRDLHHWSTIGLIDVGGTHRLNVARPLGSRLPDLRDRDYFKEVLATGKPYVSDPLRGRATPTIDIVVAVPISREGRLKYVLFCGVFPATFTALFEAQKLPAPAIASIISRNGVFIARSRDQSGLIGRPLPAPFLARIREAPEGRVRRDTVEGVYLDSAYKRMPLTGWTLDYGLPAETLDAPARRVAWLGLLVGGAIVLSAVGLALVFARRMAHDTEFLAATISALGRGEPPRPSAPLRITELESMRGLAASAGDLLRQREQERAGLLAREQAARADAEAANHAKDQFLGMLGHELRNPLGAIAGANGVLNMIGSPDERAGRARAVIERQVQHLSRLVDDLLDVTRVTSGKVRLDRRPLELGSFVTNLMTAWRLAARFDRHDVSVETMPLWVDADETRMEQIVENLVGNALKYTPAGGRVVVRVRVDGDIAVLEVSDTGVGIPPELVGRVFDLFVQGERALDRSQGGLGLGLTLVRALVAMHDGTVDVTSDGEGRGSTFRVRLPRMRAVEAPAGAASGRGTAGARVRRRILVVEDNDDAREMLCEALTLEGHDVYAASDGLAAVERAATVVPDAALIDVGLPGMNGYDVARRIRTTEAGKGIVLVALTGYGHAEDRERALDAGFDAHLTKPVTPEQIAELIERPRRR